MRGDIMPNGTDPLYIHNEDIQTPPPSHHKAAVPTSINKRAFQPILLAH